MAIHRRLLGATIAAAALLCAVLPAGAACTKPDYPRASLRNMEEGITELGFLIRTDGTVAGSVILGSSGSAALDGAARDALSQCTFKPTTRGGQPVERWIPVTYKWTIDNGQDMRRARHAAGIAASQGDVDARYRLAVLMLHVAKTEDEREQARVVLRSAAELGQPHAQFDLARRLEKGDGMARDSEAAMDWYRKSAAQGDVLAIQRLQRSTRS